MIEEWGLASVRTTVDGIPVDFLAETLAGPLIIQIVIKSLYNASTRSTIRALGYPALEISIAKPGEVLGIGELREVVVVGLRFADAHPLLPVWQSGNQVNCGPI